MKRVDREKDWEQIITIELSLKELKLIRDSMRKSKLFGIRESK